HVLRTVIIIFVCRSFSETYLYYFFFQAEDGIRDRNVTGVQTCALPILSHYLYLSTLLFTCINPVCKIPSFFIRNYPTLSNPYKAYHLITKTQPIYNCKMH